MRIIISVLAFSFASLLNTGCMMAANESRSPTSADMGPGSPANPPLPRVSSILPLEQGNHWDYSYTAYNPNGGRLYSREAMELAIPKVMGLKDDSVLSELSCYNYYGYYDCDWADSAYEYVYQYEWEDYDEGYFVVYRDVGVAVRGVYIIGDYSRRGVKRTFRNPQLWLKYPAAAGDAWSFFNFDSAGDSSRVDMELVSATEKFYFPLQSGLSPVSFVLCHLYKESHDSVEAYYYFNPDMGEVGYSQYISGTLRVTYILTAFQRGGYYYAD